MSQMTENKGKCCRAKDAESCVRLLDLHQAAAYVGLSYWTLRDYVHDGLIPAVRLPCARRRAKGGIIVRRAGDTSARRILVDRADLDRLIEDSKALIDI